MEGFMEFGRFALGFAVMLGPLLGWLMLLNLRDRRQARVLNTVLGQLSSRELRGRIAVHVRSGLLSPGSVVTVDILESSPDEVWQVMTRLAQRVSPSVRLELAGRLERRFPVTFTLETTGWRAPCSQPFPAAS